MGTTDPHRFCWLLGFPSGPFRPALDNLILPGSPERSMLMQALVRTPDRHEPTATRSPSLKPSNRTCLQEAGLQELAKAPGVYRVYQIRARNKIQRLYFCLEFCF